MEVSDNVASSSSSPTKQIYDDTERYSPRATGRSKIKLDLRTVSKGSVQIDMSMRRNLSTTRIKDSARSPLGSPVRPTVNIASVSKGFVNSVSGGDLLEAFTRRKKPEEQHSASKYDLNEEIYKRQVDWLNKTDRKRKEAKDKELKEEMKECTWTTSRKKSLQYTLEAVKRLQHWQEKKKSRLITEVEYQSGLEVEECTFQPNSDKPATVVKPTEIYDRNLEWLQLKQRRERKAKEDNYKKILKPLPNMHRRLKHSTLELFLAQAR
mmetsp:Transcript_24796/g.43676  ORF Transcript_24796/g.43676 Transcript_24796/m.43676 type:complete len:266 (+) Transcript_24796:34-831(+)|eukprot:CAMPEP_0204900710 /NCGR_PEP_ID=MMETSP1397-20131031/2638_1 /ASSEMBLY_ACC=CAM_ASM_000891 /TAXON_ID=49980 /ORGANISM="Climacostomum Climacostomum virens, Strain Stock W-24" /LENGTH=265 /DNA_ID=CAMNT_0052068915 /DNA_START=19 /DNA_END=816 /DNA_ORIENTATION=+